MKASLAALRMVVDSNIRGFMTAVMQNNSRFMVNAATKDTITDSSTGTVLTALAAINTQPAKLTPSGSNLASRSGYNASLAKVDNAIAVIRDMLLRNGFTPLTYLSASNGPMITGGTGTVATQGTVPALDKSVAAVDGSGGDAMLRQEFNATVNRVRNNLSVLLRAVNILNTALGVSTLRNTTAGSSGAQLALSNGLTATTAVAAGAVATGDLASKVAVDAALLAMANDIATIVDKFKNGTIGSATLGGRVATILTR